ncbi:MAG: hypothetical protein N3F07_02965, partial [Candidatus Micrarchaeota archaeon]|nr:hypothetical protein [Candidatus Micrarchaeota archaeon]
AFELELCPKPPQTANQTSSRNESQPQTEPKEEKQEPAQPQPPSEPSAQPSTSKQERQTLPTERVRKALEEMKQGATEASLALSLLAIGGAVALIAAALGAYLLLRARKK